MSKFLWSPYVEGISVSGLNLWLQDRFAFSVSYLEGLEPVQPWNKNLAYGSLIQAGIEGWIKTQQTKGLMRFIQNEYEAQVNEHGLSDEISWWAQLAIHQASLFVSQYESDQHLPLTCITTSERRVEVPITLPSGRVPILKGFIDGEGDGILMENKVRGSWDPESLARNLPLDLQYNYYLFLLFTEKKELPSKVWYQTIRRPGSWGYRGPRRRKNESGDDYLQRVKDHMDGNPDYYFYRYLGTPTPHELSQFLHATLYPILEAFLDWYAYKLNIHLGLEDPNHVDWMTPYGLYNPFVEGTEEKFREYRLTGSSIGLRKKTSR